MRKVFFFFFNIVSKYQTHTYMKSKFTYTLNFDFKKEMKITWELYETWCVDLCFEHAVCI